MYISDLGPFVIISRYCEAKTFTETDSRSVGARRCNLPSRRPIRTLSFVKAVEDSVVSMEVAVDWGCGTGRYIGNVGKECSSISVSSRCESLEPRIFRSGRNCGLTVRGGGGEGGVLGERERLSLGLLLSFGLSFPDVISASFGIDGTRVEGSSGGEGDER